MISNLDNWQLELNNNRKNLNNIIDNIEIKKEKIYDLQTKIKKILNNYNKSIYETNNNL